MKSANTKGTRGGWLAIAVLLFAGLPFLGAHAEGAPAGEPPALDDILTKMPESQEASAIPEIRYGAVRETALAYGAQAGLARRTYEAIEKLKKVSGNLDVIYDFTPLIIDSNIIPPVIVKTVEDYDQQADDTFRVIGQTYRILSPARFTYAPPSWRNYLIQSYPFDESRLAAVAPKGDDEKALWKKSVEEGFRLGVAQAEEIFKENLARLRRDYEGMVLYHDLEARGMVSKPVAVSVRQGVARADDGSLHIDETVYKITIKPDFVESPTSWKKAPAGLAPERVKRVLDPARMEQMLKAAQASGIVKDAGR